MGLRAKARLGIPRSQTNLHGGGISMCLGSGLGMATLIENLQR